MAKKLTREELLQQKEAAEKNLTHYQNRLTRAENKLKDYAKTNRSRRIHHFCLRGGTIEKMIPELAELTDQELFSLTGMVSRLPEFRSCLNRLMENHRGKDGDEDGSVSLPCHPDQTQ